MISSTEKELCICVTPNGVFLGRLTDVVGSSVETGVHLEYPVILNMAVSNGAMQVSLTPFAIPCTKDFIANASAIVFSDNMNERFRNEICKNYESMIVKARSGLVLA